MYNFITLLNDFIKSILHLSHLNLHVIDLLTMLAHCILYLLDSLHQDNYLVLHSTSPVIPLGQQWMVIYASSLYFPRV